MNQTLFLIFFVLLSFLDLSISSPITRNVRGRSIFDMTGGEDSGYLDGDFNDLNNLNDSNN